MGGRCFNSGKKWGALGVRSVPCFPGPLLAGEFESGRSFGPGQDFMKFILKFAEAKKKRKMLVKFADSEEST